MLDIACGGGDVTVALARWARRKGLPIQMLGCDRSATALAIAREHAQRAGLFVEFFEADALRSSLPDDIDAVISSLFLHHLSEDEAIDFLSRMAKGARSLVLVNDLVRSRANYFLVGVACHLLSTSPVVRMDGPLSVQGAFTVEEAQKLAEQAGLTGARITRRWPARFLLEWWRD